MSTHVAILLRPYLKLILQGRKTIESRLTRTPLAPYRRIQPGDRIYFKCSAGPYMATAVADRIEFHEDLTRAKVQELCRRLNHAVCGDAQFWQWKRDSRYATFITLRDVQPTDTGPHLAPSRGLAWFVRNSPSPLRGEGRVRGRGNSIQGRRHSPQQPRTRSHTHRLSNLSPGVTGKEILAPLTAGALRNHYVRLPATTAATLSAIDLLLPDGTHVRTDIVKGTMIRWRGWRPYFEEHRLLPGDAVRLEPIGPAQYRVRFVSNDNPSTRTK